jgi:hypothetical protein
MNLSEKINLITEKVVDKLLMIEGYEQSSKPGDGMNAKYIYHCAREKDLPSIFKFGFERFYFGKGVGEMYGPGIYCTTDLQSSIVNSYRGLYGPVIVRAEIKTYKGCLIWEPIIAKEVYGDKWRMSDQLQMLVPEYIEQMKQLRVIGDFNDGASNMYEFINKWRERTSVGARQIWAQRNNFKGGSPYDKIRGFVFYGSVDGHTAVLKDAKNAIPLEYSIDHGKTWKYARTKETLRYTRDDFDVELDYGKKYKKTYPVEFGYSKVENHKGKINYINKDGEEISNIWFDGGSDFTEVIAGFPTAEVIYNGVSVFLSVDRQIYEKIKSQRV